MASVPAIFLLFLLLSVAVRAQQKYSNMIDLGSSLSPTTHPASWLSPSGLFAFGFYPQGNGFAVGIWLVVQPETIVVWTANRDDPPVSSSATLNFTKDGKLLLQTEQGQEKPVAEFPETAMSASMLDSGNFVFYDNDSRVVWESFNFPTDTILGTQNLSNGSKLLSSVSTSDHSSGRFYLAMQVDGNLVAYPVISMSAPEDAYWATVTSGTTSLILNLNDRGLLYLRDSAGLNVHTVANSSYSDNKKITIYRATLDADGVFRLYSHSFEINDYSLTVSLEWSSLQNQCEVHGFCGFNSFCSGNDTKAECSCFPGFAFVNPDMKFLGCYRCFNDEVDCGRKEPPLFCSITSLNNTKLGGFPYFVKSMNKEDCGKSCLEDCNCGAALHSKGTCSKQKLPLTYGRVNQNELAMAFFKMSMEDYNNPPIPGEPIVIIESKKELIKILAVSLGSITLLFFLIAISIFILYRGRVHRYKRLQENFDLTKEFSLRSFSYNELKKATDQFKEEYMLGRGSFGAVYKGSISEGNKIVAVKKIENVVEGEREFRAEMTSIGRKHHRNLVQLLGYCAEDSKRLLVYEYMKNGSLADLLCRAENGPNWNERERIALDVARGIHYLHEECETQTIHCDIKPQNILMDDSWTAKISDFRLAKLLMRDETRTFTGVRGTTTGYMGPEWHNNAPISVKVDIYSYGIVLLEIVCFRKKMEVNVSKPEEVYNCFVAGELEKLVSGEVDMNSLEKMVKVGLWCIQEDPSFRPSMKEVVLMLEGITEIDFPPCPTTPSM